MATWWMTPCELRWALQAKQGAAAHHLLTADLPLAVFSCVMRFLFQSFKIKHLFHLQVKVNMLDPTWCEEESLLAAMFGLQHRGASHDQSSHKKFTDILRHFWENMAMQVSSAGGFNLAVSIRDHRNSTPCLYVLQVQDGYGTEMPKSVLKCLPAVSFMAHSSRITWLPRYGCALLALGADEESAGMGLGELNLHLVCLDNWEFRLHRQVESQPAYGILTAFWLFQFWVLTPFSPMSPSYSTAGGIECRAECLGHTVVSAGRLRADQDLEKLISRLEFVMSASSQAKKDDSTKKGHQTTPAFVKAALARALETLHIGDDDEASILTAPVHAAGGFTDVGRHTGSEARSTAWPLVREVLKVWLIAIC